MPIGKPKKLFPHLYKGSKPAEGGAVGGGQAPVTAPSVREPIRDMLAPGSEESFIESLPSDTSTPAALPGAEEVKTRKPRTPKAPVDSDDPMNDARYKKAIGNMSGLGGARIIKVGFQATGKPLQPEESDEVDDLFYVIGKRSKLDPGSSWVILGVYAFFFLCRLIVMRTEAGKNLSKLFDKPKEEVEEPKKEA